MQNLAPIALFVYNRPQHTERTVKFLKQNELAADSRLFIFSDGAKSETDADKHQLPDRQARCKRHGGAVAAPRAPGGHSGEKERQAQPED